jgi:hypothetical protein
MSLKFYTDVHIPKQVAVQLRNRGVDIVRCEEVGMNEASDEAHLEYASAEGRILVSMDRDFVRLHTEWLQSNRTHHGIFSVSTQLKGKLAIGPVVNIIWEYFQLFETGAANIEDDFIDHIFFIG